ncbi:MAG: universal stress protein [Dehalococcoidales bacterium]|jgi:nucleotide-binding universal stress UspA family protein
MYTKILVLLDGSEPAEKALPYVDWFVKVSKVNEIVFLRVVEPLHMPRGMETAVMPGDRQRIEEDAVKLASEYLDKVSSGYAAKKLKVTSVVLVGNPVKVIAGYVAKSDVDLIIMATHGYSGIHRWVRGGAADEIIEAAHAPIFLVSPGDRLPED